MTKFQQTTGLPFNDDSTENSNDRCVMPWSFSQVVVDKLNSKALWRYYRLEEKGFFDKGSSSLLEISGRDMNVYYCSLPRRSDQLMIS